MTRLAEDERFEEAALVRDRLRALVGGLITARRERWLVGAERLEVDVDGRRVAFRRGALERRGDEPGFDLPLPLEAADEVRAATSWLADRRPRVVACRRPIVEPIDGGAALERFRRALASRAGAAGRP